ncbi:hypothetical protein D3Z33_13440 [Senegalia massiliensis]|uniref:Magnesium transporter MgtE intracellular domain-containing protein n=2 Tax=Senegalia massiliensis TaxID=1720316 RepID=A0A845R2R0_9CLOT|nr:hypothetical protein [Senegalia massiliensis]
MGDYMKNEGIKKGFKILIVIVIVFIVIPITSLAILYSTNRDFKMEANKYLRIIPGPIGNYFNQYPTTAEANDKVFYIAEYYNAISEESAADKLFIIKKDNEELYYQIVQAMNKISPEKTEETIKKVRNIELRKDPLISVYDEIDSEKKDELKEDIKKIESKELLVAKKIILEYYNDQNFQRVNDIFENISTSKTIDLLYYFNEDIYDYVLNNLEKNKAIEVNIGLTEKELEYEKLLRQSEIYQVNKVSDTIKEIGNDDNYNLNQLAIIYLNLTIDKAANVLVEIDDDEFQKELFTEMRNIELLNEELDSRIVKLASKIEDIKKYKTKIEDLVKVYQKMDSESLSVIIEDLFKENSKLVVDVLDKMNEKKVAEILSFIDSDTANQISKQLTT